MPEGFYGLCELAGDVLHLLVEEVAQHVAELAEGIQGGEGEGGFGLAALVVGAVQVVFVQQDLQVGQLDAEGFVLTAQLLEDAGGDGGFLAAQQLHVALGQVPRRG